jgi:hypothetical protein
MEISMPKSAKKSSARSSPKPLSAARRKPSQEPARPTAPRSGGVSKEIATSKQTQLIAMLQSAPGATIAAMMQQTNSLLIALSVLMRFPQSDSRPFAVCIDEYYTRGL